MPSSIRALLAPESGDDVSLPDGNSDVVPSLGTGGEGWDSLHQDFSSLKGDLDSLKHRIAEAEKERNSLQTNAMKPPKPRSMFSSFKPKKFFQKLFFSNKKVSSSASSRDSETQSSMPISGISGPSGKGSSRPTRRHSITWISSPQVTECVFVVKWSWLPVGCEKAQSAMVTQVATLHPNTIKNTFKPPFYPIQTCILILSETQFAFWIAGGAVGLTSPCCDMPWKAPANLRSIFRGLLKWGTPITVEPLLLTCHQVSCVRSSLLYVTLTTLWLL